MNPHAPRPAEFWDDLERMVARRVEAALHDRPAKRDALIEYLRHVEEMARTECDRRQTVQIIASGRSLLGDRRAVGPEEGPFTRA
ncbi:hypothetical protein QO016_004447 [Methylobacterium persicinum]|uniref:Uncharacterized protein n=2 Tax=Methylobacterium persicinum TaxID=374426 RepID=A0ABU0HRG5_9HYPH|nr:hypothetical protein [Methylobacterium persicinum]GJE39884.1 hypothetical protein KHHGKMAE_3972 [Methylobacterium persicinum]